MVIDGVVEFNSANGRRASDEIARAAALEKTAVRLTRNENKLKIETDTPAHASDIMLALAEDSATSEVAAGENKASICALWRSCAACARSGLRGAQFAQNIELGKDAAGKRVIVFLQDSDLGRISGAASLVP